MIGVEPEDSNRLQAALAAGERVVLGQVGLFADGVAVAQIGACNFEVCKDHVDEVITVGSDEICAAIKDIYDDTRSITEPAGALAVAGIKKYVARERTEGQTLVAIDSGANINFDRLRHVAERAELGEQREAIIAVTVAERPGSFKAFCAALGRRQITEFNYRYHSDRQAHLFVGADPSAHRQPRRPARRPARAGLPGTRPDRQRDGQAAHPPHGRRPRYRGAPRAAVPLRVSRTPRALLNFLDKLGSRWNISLFHYRNHGAADGRVLAGLQVPDEERGELEAALQAIGYPYWEETHNPAYRLFAG